MIKKIMLTVVMCFVFVGSIHAEVIEVNTMERMVLLSLLPVEASYATWKIIQELRMELSFTEEELVLIDLKPDVNGNTTANWEAVDPKSVEFGVTAARFIEDALLALDEQEKLLPEHVSLYEKFIVKE